MKIPNFWSEQSIETEFINSRGMQKMTTIKRFGWSDDSIESARQHAIVRCEEARNALKSGFVKRVEAKNLYLDETGLPIREEIVQRYDDIDCVTTINSYGATCLNTANVMILDVDIGEIIAEHCKANNLKIKHEPQDLDGFLFGLIVGLYCAFLAFNNLSWMAGLLAFIIGVATTSIASMLFVKFKKKRYQQWLSKLGDLYDLYKPKLDDFLNKKPDFSFNVYKTPNGLRLIATHATYTPDDEEVQLCFSQLLVDNNYARLCNVQKCFRARVTGKPWRMDVKDRPYKYFWMADDVASKQIEQRNVWLNSYYQVAQNYRACKFIEQVGNKPMQTNDRVKKVIELHDVLCNVDKELELA